MYADKPTPSQRRVTVLMALLRRGQATTRELADALGLKPKTVRDDLKHILDVAPIRSEGAGRHRRWQVDDGFAAEGLGMLDRISLKLGRSLTEFLSGTALGEVARPVRPLDGVPRRYLPNLKRKIRLLREPTRNYAAHRDTIYELLDGLLGEQRLSFAYRRQSGVEQVDNVAPLTLIVYRRALYLLARLSTGEDRRFSIDQISEVQVREPFDYPRDHDPDACLTPWFGIHTGTAIERVHLHLSARVARYVLRRTWHSTQKLMEREDGSVDLYMKTGGQELVRFCLEWGGQVEVVAPPWLRAAVIDELKDAVRTYPELSVAPSPPSRTSPSPPTAHG